MWYVLYYINALFVVLNTNVIYYLKITNKQIILQGMQGIKKQVKEVNYLGLE